MSAMRKEDVSLSFPSLWHHKQISKRTRYSGILFEFDLQLSEAITQNSENVISCSSIIITLHWYAISPFKSKLGIKAGEFFYHTDQLELSKCLTPKMTKFCQSDMKLRKSGKVWWANAFIIKRTGKESPIWTPRADWFRGELDPIHKTSRCCQCIIWHQCSKHAYPV